MKTHFMIVLAAVVLLSGALQAKERGKVEGVLNLNTATLEQLTLLPGIGQSKGEAIVTYRTTHPFTAAEEVAEVKGIGPKLFGKISPYLAIQGETNLHEAKASATAPVAPVIPSSSATPK